MLGEEELQGEQRQAALAHVVVQVPHEALAPRVRLHGASHREDLGLEQVQLRKADNRAKRVIVRKSEV